MGVMEWFKVALAVQLFYGLAVSLMVYGLSDAPNYSNSSVQNFLAANQDFNTETIAEDIGVNADKQFEIGVRDVGSLAYFSGNFLIDLVVNAATAIPQMFGLLIYGIGYYVGLDKVIASNLQLFVAVLVGALYVLAIIEMLVGVRSGRSIG